MPSARVIREALDQTDWNVSAAARLLDTERTALHRGMRTLSAKRSNSRLPFAARRPAAAVLL